LERKRAKLAEETAKKEAEAKAAVAAAAEAKRLLAIAKEVKDKATAIAKAAKEAEDKAAAAAAAKAKNKNSKSTGGDKVSPEAPNEAIAAAEEAEKEAEKARMEAMQVAEQAEIAEGNSKAALADAMRDNTEHQKELDLAAKIFKMTVIKEEKKLVRTRTHTHALASSYSPTQQTTHTQPHTHTRAHHRMRLGARQVGSNTTKSRTRGRTTKPRSGSFGLMSSTNLCKLLFVFCVRLDGLSPNKTLLHAFAVGNGFTPMAGVFLTCWIRRVKPTRPTKHS